RIVVRLTEVTLHTWNNPLGVNHVYLGKKEQCLYAGYVGLIHARGLRQAIKAIQNRTVADRQV
ncbi:MAG: hypothetical protein RLZZ574_3580, partial [Cyanobacteriota bacterium]